MGVVSGELCNSNLDSGDFKDQVQKSGGYFCDAEKKDYTCSGAGIKCPANKSTSAQQFQCCVVIKCSNNFYECNLKGKAQFSLGGYIQESKQLVDKYATLVTVQGAGFDAVASKNLFKCKDADKQEIGCRCTKSSYGSATLEFDLSLTKEGPLYATVHLIGNIDANVDPVQIATVGPMWLERYKYYFLGVGVVAIGLFFISKGTKQSPPPPGGPMPPMMRPPPMMGPRGYY